jgi:hypothetical protein
MELGGEPGDCGRNHRLQLGQLFGAMNVVFGCLRHLVVGTVRVVQRVVLGSDVGQGVLGDLQLLVNRCSFHDASPSCS